MDLWFLFHDVFAKLLVSHRCVETAWTRLHFGPAVFGLLRVVVLGIFPFAAMAVEPSAAPSAFTTGNYGLTFKIPEGLFRCSYPASWVGSDHGVDIYLAKPTACDPNSPSATGAEGNDLPRIEIFYAYNVAEISTPGQEPHAPATNAELMASHCPPSAKPLPAEVTLMGGPAIGCVISQGSRVSLTMGSLYSQERGAGGKAPDSLVIVSLHTSDRRYERDVRSLRTVAASIRACDPQDRRGQRDRQTCPQATAW